MQPARRLVLGTTNRKKVAELISLLAPIGFELTSLDDFPAAIEVDETGDSFAANAALKAALQARRLNAWVLGEDSGIAVDALDGAPGIYSARYAGPRATDDENNRRLLAELAETPLAKRTAHYVSRLALADPLGNIRIEAEGTCRGLIRFDPAGSAGFGYDPLFEILEYHRTIAELGESIKAVLSHRARAADQFIARVAEFLDAGHWNSTRGV